MRLNIVYAYINKGVMFNRSHMMLLLSCKFLSNRFWVAKKRNLGVFFERFRMNPNRSCTTFEVLSGRMLFD